MICHRAGQGDRNGDGGTNTTQTDTTEKGPYLQENGEGDLGRRKTNRQTDNKMTKRQPAEKQQ